MLSLPFAVLSVKSARLLKIGLILFRLKTFFLGIPAFVCVVDAWLHYFVPFIVLCILWRIVVLLLLVTALSALYPLMLMLELDMVRYCDGVLSCISVARSLICVIAWWPFVLLEVLLGFDGGIQGIQQ